MESAGSALISQSNWGSPFIRGKIWPCKRCIYIGIYTYLCIFTMLISNWNNSIKGYSLDVCSYIRSVFIPRIVLYDSKDWCVFGLSLLGQHCLYCGVLDGRWTNSNVGTSKKRVFWGWWERDATFSSKGRVRRLINVCVNEGYVDVPLKYLLAMVTKKTCLPWKHPFCIFFSVRWVELPHAGTYWALSACVHYFPGLVYLIDFVCVWNICNYEFISWEPKRVSIYDFLHGTVDLYT